MSAPERDIISRQALARIKGALPSGELEFQNRLFSLFTSLDANDCADVVAAIGAIIKKEHDALPPGPVLDHSPVARYREFVQNLHTSLLQISVRTARYRETKFSEGSPIFRRDTNVWSDELPEVIVREAERRKLVGDTDE